MGNRSKKAKGGGVAFADPFGEEGPGGRAILQTNARDLARGPAQFGTMQDDRGEEITMSTDQVEIVRAGSQITLPENMTYSEGIIWLKRQREEEEQEVGIRHEIDAYPLDGAYAFRRAIERVFGFAAAGAPKFNFFLGKIPGTTMLAVSTGIDTAVEVPWGEVNIPGVEGELNTGMNDPKSQKPKFVITGMIKQKDRPKVLKIYELTKEIIRSESIYRGKAIRVDFSYLRDGRPFVPNEDEPKFMDISKVDPDGLVFEATTDRIINMTLFSLIRNTEAMRQVKVPLKRGVLLAGTYGTGKTLTANVTAKIATDHGWTFIYVKDVRDLAHALRFAKNYAPAVVFAEDADRAVSGERTTSIDEILNTIDGVDTKSEEIITVLTTNHLEKINQAMLRPGRLDSVVIINPPDVKAAGRLIKLYGRGLLAEDFNYEAAGEELAGRLPAIIRECVERAKAAAVDRLGTGDIEGQVQADDVITAARAMKQQIELLTPQTVDSRPAHIQYGDALGSAIGRELAGKIETAANSRTNGAAAPYLPVG
jgi:transitional endoplasmic reticulum ATPase